MKTESVTVDAIQTNKHTVEFYLIDKPNFFLTTVTRDGTLGVRAFPHILQPHHIVKSKCCQAVTCE